MARRFAKPCKCGGIVGALPKVHERGCWACVHYHEMKRAKV